MNSEEMIKILEYLGDKFGMIVDWTSENVIPYAKDLIGRIITYKIISNAIGAVICLAIAIGAVFFIGHTCKLCHKARILSHKSYPERKYTHAWYYDGDELSMAGGIAIALSSLFGFICLICFMIFITEIIKWYMIPELQLWDLVKGIS